MIFYDVLIRKSLRLKEGVPSFSHGCIKHIIIIIIIVIRDNLANICSEGFQDASS